MLVYRKPYTYTHLQVWYILKFSIITLYYSLQLEKKKRSPLGNELVHRKCWLTEMYTLTWYLKKYKKKLKYSQRFDSYMTNLQNVHTQKREKLLQKKSEFCSVLHCLAMVSCTSRFHKQYHQNKLIKLQRNWYPISSVCQVLYKQICNLNFEPTKLIWQTSYHCLNYCSMYFMICQNETDFNTLDAVRKGSFMWVWSTLQLWATVQRQPQYPRDNTSNRWSNASDIIYILAICSISALFTF